VDKFLLSSQQVDQRARVNQLHFRNVDAACWADFARLFEERGGPKSCWCMVWRASSAEAKCKDGSNRRVQIKSRVDGGIPIGLIGYMGEQPVAWCSIAPRETYRPLGGLAADLATERIWSLACLFIKRDHRGKGLTAELITAAVAHAKAHKATILEAYPVDADSPSYRFMGFVDAFASAGFQEVGRAGQRRHVMRLILSDPAHQEGA
jgi:GNAT superfamily N-acetyltransferase